MTLASGFRRSMTAVVVALSGLASTTAAQTWRQSAAGLGTTARVLIIGARPKDEDNALIAWLRLGRNVETAYLSLTRGESSPNIAGTERQSALAVVRTAELLAERGRDGAHQYFTRAYDFGSTASDSIVNAGWPHDVLLVDLVSVIRAFRPHVIISVISDSAERDATRRFVARLTREAFTVAADTTRLSSAETSRLPAWSVSRLFTRVDSTVTGAVAIDVGEFDRSSGRSFAELGAEIRRLQRTQPAPVAPAIGRTWRYLRLDSTRVGRTTDDDAGLFGADTTFGRFRGAVSPETQAQVDSLRSELARVHDLATNGAPDSLAGALARVVKRTSEARLSFPCNDVSGVPLCSGATGDLAVALRAIGERAVRAMIGAAGIVIDGTVARELVAAGDSVPLAIDVFNGGASPISIRRLAASSGSGLKLFVRDTTVVLRPDGVAHWSGNVRVMATTLHWWQTHGLVPGKWIHEFVTTRANSVPAELINGEDRIGSSSVEATIAVAGIDVPIIERPLVYRSIGMVRGDNRHPLAGISPISVLLERTAEYERAGIPVDRLFRVFLSSSRVTPETLQVSLSVPAGLRVDSASRVAIVPPLGTRNVFFRLRGKLGPSSDSVFATAGPVVSKTQTNASTPARVFTLRSYNYGSIGHDYPHIPSQQFIRSSKERLEAVDLRVPPRLRVAYIKGNDDLLPPLGQLQVNVQNLDPSLVSVVDLTWYTTIVIGADALANDALAGAVGPLRDFMRNGGTVVVLPGRDEIPQSGLLPYPVAFDSVAGRVSNPSASVRVTDARSQLVSWPNRITQKDFEDWSGERARNVPSTFDPRYQALLSVGDPGEAPTAATVLAAPVGKGMIVYTSLSLDRQLVAVNAGAARFFVNLLSAGLKPGAK